MSSRKHIILAILPVKPENLEEIKSLSAETLVPTLAEEGCEMFYQTSKKDDPSTLVFFEVFESKAAADWHREQGYTQKFFTGIEGKLSGEPSLTVLEQL